MKSILFMLWTATAVWGQFVSSGGSLSSGGAARGGGLSCGPPTYSCSRSDSNVITAPSVPPQVGPNICTAGSLVTCGNTTGVNTIVTDPIFNNKIVRVTDVNQDAAFPNLSQRAGCGGSQGSMTFNTNSTLLVVCNVNSRTYPMQFNPSTMQVTKLYVGATGFPNGYFVGNDLRWSRANPYLGYVLSGTVINGYCFADVVAGVCPSAGPLDTVNPPTTGNGRIFTVYDFASSNACLGTAIFPGGFNPGWVNFGEPTVNDASFSAAYGYDISGTANVTNGSTDVTWNSGTQFDKRYKAGNTFILNGLTYHIASINSATDITLTAAYTGATSPPPPSTGVSYTLKSFQGTGVNAVVYIPGSGCTMLNTETGVVTSDFGSGGTIGISDRWTMHDSFSSASSTWTYIGATTCLSTSCPNSSGLPYFWKTGTTTITGCSGGICGGHWTEAAGNQGIINNGGNGAHASYDYIRFENAFLNITSISVAGGTGTITWSGSGPTFASGQSIQISGSSVSACNNTFTLLSATTFSAGSCTTATGGSATVATVLPNSSGENTVVAPWDTHPSWNEQGTDDARFFVTSTFCTSTPCLTPYTQPLQNEIYGKNPVTGAIARFANTYSADKSQTFEAAQSIGQVSQDGKFFMFTSDWMGTLGSTTGAAACTVGTDCRGDVFVVELK
jgi:hypothetical protein